MIKQNVTPLIDNLSDLILESKALIRTLKSYQAAESITDLTPEQETGIMANVQSSAGDLASAYNSAKDIFTSNTPV